MASKKNQAAPAPPNFDEEPTLNTSAPEIPPPPRMPDPESLRPGGASGKPGGDAVTPSLESVVHATQQDTAVPRYRVMNGGYIMAMTGKTFLHAGKVVDPRIYDVERLRSQGIILEEVP